MAKMTTEERHKKQKEKLMGDAQVEQIKPRQKTMKDKIIEELESTGLQCEMKQGIPMFKVKSKSEFALIKEKFQGVGSFGVTYEPVGDLKNGLDEVSEDE